MERDLYFCPGEQVQIFKLWRQFAFIEITMSFINITVGFIKFAFHNEIISLILIIDLIFVNLM